MIISDSRASPPLALTEEVTRLLDGPATHELQELLSRWMSNIAENERTRAILRYIAAHVSEVGPTKSQAYLTEVSNAILSVPGLRDVAFGREQYLLTLAFAGALAAVGDEAQASALDLRVLNVPPNMAQHVRPQERLESAARLVRSASVPDEIALRAVPLFRRVCRQLSDSSELAATTPTLISFLSDLGVSLARRGYFIDASRAWSERQQLGSGEPLDFERAVGCALLAEAGPVRQRLLSAYAVAPASRELGPLSAVLATAAHAHLLREAEVEVLSQCSIVVAAGVSQAAVLAAANQHNIVAISKFYDNISFAALARLMNGMDEAAVGESVAKMAAEDRLDARVDQASGWVVFRTPDSAISMGEWDSRIGTVCNALSHATELATMSHTELRRYLQDHE